MTTPVSKVSPTLGEAWSEATFQAHVLQAAYHNGWRITYEHAMHQRDIGGITYWIPVWAGKMLPRIQQFLLQRRRLAFTLGYHTHDSRNSQSGFPDLVLIHPERGEIIFAELKTNKAYPTLEQRLWLAALSCVAERTPFVNVYLWTPKLWPSIIHALGGKNHLAHNASPSTPL